MDLVYAYDLLMQDALGSASEESRDSLKSCFERKYSLLRRPLERLMSEPHML